MSRLDDELREAFRRHEPSPDFAARVIDLAKRQPAPKKNGWKQMLVELFQPPKLRWVAIGVTASLLIALAAGAYRNSHRAERQPSVTVGAGSSAPAPQGPPPQVSPPRQERLIAGPPPAPKNRDARHGGLRPNAAQLEHQRELRAEAEAAKEKVMFALQIASATLNDAQRSIQDVSYKSKP